MGLGADALRPAMEDYKKKGAAKQAAPLCFHSGLSRRLTVF